MTGWFGSPIDSHESGQDRGKVTKVNSRELEASENENDSHFYPALV